MKSFLLIALVLFFLFVSYASAKNKCQLPSDVGKGKASFTRYYYNEEGGKCETFIYGGVGGNSNNFLTKEDCCRECAQGSC
uniref:Kunitz-type serine protease inhibitor LmKTT-1b n=1 Tax=Lychas mucronatus TaxID=172552 RepID=VKT22_LYCMC|nr:RecName: Full=Kunitz-type serine protease inhibitor LmKTT-1b; AltName: Full=Delta-KTx 2.2; AltName: Full=SdPI; Flags: Precursor [Lychas mucronatus]